MYHLTGSRRISHQHNRQFYPLSMTPPPLSWGQQGQQHPPRRHQVFTMIRALWDFFADFSSTSEASGFRFDLYEFFSDYHHRASHRTIATSLLEMFLSTPR